MAQSIFIHGSDGMTIQEASERYMIPIKILKEYESWGLCGAVKKVMGAWQYRSGDREDNVFTIPIYLFETEPAVPDASFTRVLRVLVCDPAGKYPWEPDCAPVYGYTKAEAIRRYKEDCKIVFEVREKLQG